VDRGPDQDPDGGQDRVEQDDADQGDGQDGDDLDVGRGVVEPVEDLGEGGDAVRAGRGEVAGEGVQGWHGVLRSAPAPPPDGHCG
jgi:hypothetical protein